MRTSPTRTWSGTGNRTSCRVETGGVWRGTIRTVRVESTTRPGVAGRLVWQPITPKGVWLDSVAGDNTTAEQALLEATKELKENRMPIDASQITPEILDKFNDSLRISGHDAIELYGLSAALRDVLNLPQTRQVVSAAVEREHAEMMAALPDWTEMSDLDKGAALMHLWKRDNEGDDYATENYPAKFIEDPRLTGLDREDACDHAARFEDVSEELQEENSNEWSRLYDLALNHERGN